jgi:hypothetical protein
MQTEDLTPERLCFILAMSAFGSMKNFTGLRYMRVLVGCVHDQNNEACLAFTVGIVNLQSILLSMSNMDAVISFCTSRDELLNQFHNDKSYDVLVVVDTMLGLNPTFVKDNLQHLDRLHFVTSVYPLPGVDWKALEDKSKTKTTEELRFRGLHYNVKLQNPIKPDSSGERILAKQATLRTFIIDRTVIDQVAENSPSYSFGDKENHLFWCDTVVDGKHKDPSDTFMSRWKGDVWADVERQGAGFGLLSFAGCVGYRNKIR